MKSTAWAWADEIQRIQRPRVQRPSHGVLRDNCYFKKPVTTKVTVSFETGHRYFVAPFICMWLGRWSSVWTMARRNAQMWEWQFLWHPKSWVEATARTGGLVKLFTLQSLWLVLKVLAASCLPKLRGHPQQMKNKIWIKSKIKSSKVMEWCLRSECSDFEPQNLTS